MSALQTAIQESTPPRPLAVTVDDAARLIGISKWTVRAYARSGRLRVGRFGRKIVVPFDALEELLHDSIQDLK